MLDLAHLLAINHELIVTFITALLNASTIQPTIDSARRLGLPITFIELPLSSQQVGLPEGCEDVNVIPSSDPILKFFRAMRLLKDQLELYILRLQDSYPACIIADACQYWTQEVARNLRAPRLPFHSCCLFTLLCLHNIFRNVYGNIIEEHEPFVIPGLPQKVMIAKAQARGFFYCAQVREDR